MEQLLRKYLIVKPDAVLKMPHSSRKQILKDVRNCFDFI